MAVAYLSVLTFKSKKRSVKITGHWAYFEVGLSVREDGLLSPQQRISNVTSVY